jgi:6,7-dimethyl-8-ribityllumazine synthase
LTEPRPTRIWEGNPGGTSGRYGLVAAKFNAAIVERLVAGAVEVLKANGVQEVEVAWVPGALEIPLVAQRFAASGRFDAVIVLGTVIRGDTTHYDVVAENSAAGCAQASLKTGVPILNAILTVENIEQALARAGGSLGNKGGDAALAALEMVDLLARLSSPSKDDA